MPEELRIKILRVVVGLVCLILATAVHEFAHVAMARWLGDDHGTRVGRFTLNPLVHIDPIWTVIMPAVMLWGGAGILGAGKPAPYIPRNLDRKFNGKRITLRFAELLVALAGPASNVLMCFITAAIFGILLKTGVLVSLPGEFAWAIKFFLTMNIVLALFNMIPIPPLDGSKILFSLLPFELARKYDEVATKLSLPLLVVFILLGGYVLSPMVRFAEALLIGWMY